MRHVGQSCGFEPQRGSCGMWASRVGSKASARHLPLPPTAGSRWSETVRGCGWQAGWPAGLGGRCECLPVAVRVNSVDCPICGAWFPDLGQTRSHFRFTKSCRECPWVQVPDELLDPAKLRVASKRKTLLKVARRRPGEVEPQALAPVGSG